MRILSISSVPLLPHLGSGQTRLHWTRGLQELGHTVDVLEPKDFELFPFIRKGKKYRQAMGVLFKVKKLLRKKNYDIIEFFGDEYWLLLSRIKKNEQKLPLLIAHADGVELHDMDKAQTYWDPKTGLKKWWHNNTNYRFSKLTFLLADYLVCGCNDDLQYLAQHNYFSAQNAECIAPGIEDSFHIIPFCENKKNIISFVGSWIGRKGIHILPIVLNAILKQHADFVFHIFGTKEKPESILNNFDPSVRERITVFSELGLPELQQHLIETSIFFMPTYSEGFGLSTVEAMSCGCTAVTTPTGVGKELAQDREAVICNFDDTENMINSISCLIDDSDKRKEIAYNGWLKAKAFVWKKQVDKLEATYLSWLNCTASKNV